MLVQPRNHPSAAAVPDRMLVGSNPMRLGWRERLLNTIEQIPRGIRWHIIVAHDLLASLLSLLLALWLRLGGLSFDTETTKALAFALPAFAICFATSGFILRVHLGMWRYASLPDLVAILKTATVSIAALYLIVFVAQRLDGIPRSVPLIQWFVLVFLLGGSRLVYRLLRDGKSAVTAALGETSERLVPVLLVGTGGGTPLFLRALREAPNQPFVVVGIVEPGASQTGRRILGVPVLGYLPDLTRLVERLEARGERPTRLIVTESLAPAAMERLVEEASHLGIVLCRMPEPLAFREASQEGRIDLRPVALEDLLNRPQVSLDESAIGRLIEGRRVLVTGAGGSIGSELVRQIAVRSPAEIALIDSSEFNLYTIDHEISGRYPKLRHHTILADVRQRERVVSVLKSCRPEIVFHAAALKHVPMVELNPCEGILTNALGTRNVADAVLACGAEAMILISTDKAVNPTNIMGASKRLAEFYCQALDLDHGQGRGSGPCPRFMTVRFGNVLGSSGSVVPLFQKQLAEGGPLTITHPEIKRYFMTIPEAVVLILHASAHGLGRDDERGQIFVLDMGEPLRIVDVARRLIRLAGLEPGRDVGIEVVGLRPGEKLYEELFDDAERRLGTSASGINAAVSRPVDLATLRAILDRLADACHAHDEAALRALIAGIIPGYAPGIVPDHQPAVPASAPTAAHGIPA